jgi:hypothetical protein
MEAPTQPSPEGADEMNKELIAPAAAIAVEVLAQTKHAYGEVTDEVIASAFETAYQGLAKGIARIRASEPKSTLFV